MIILGVLFYLSCLVFSEVSGPMFSCLSLIFLILSISIVSNTSSSPFSLLLQLFRLYTCYTIWNCTTVLWYSTHFFSFFFHLVFQFGSDYWSIFRLTDSFFDCAQYMAVPINGNLHFCYSVLISSIPSWIIVRDSISLLSLLFICSCMLSTLLL